MTFMKKLDILPGVLLCVAIAIPSILFHQYIYKPISSISVAIILGLIINNTIRLPSIYKKGISFSLKRILRWGIILLGIRLSFIDVLKIGGNALVVIIICITTAIFLVKAIAKKMRLPEKLGTLVGVGTAICGNSAIVATAPVIDAKEEDVACSVTIVTFFGVLAVFVYPIVGHLLKLAESTFGTWAGTAINDTSQVVAAGFMYSQRSGEIATVVKLTRTLFMAPVIVLLGYIYTRSKNEEIDKGVQLRKKIHFKKIFPWFLLGFLAMALIRTMNILPSAMINIIKSLAKYFIVTALAGIGLTTDFKIMRQECFKRPLGVGLIAASIMGVLSITIIKVLGM